MFGPHHLKYLIKFLDGIDYALSQRMLRKHPPDEPALTNELCALLDAETQELERRLSYRIDHLNLDLAAPGDDLEFELIIDTYPHNTAMESYVSQSDFGFILEYDNRVLPDLNWSAAYLVQAKRAFRNLSTGLYDEKCRFEAVNSQQQTRLDRLSRVLGPGSLWYCLYCPPTPALDDTARKQVRALHTRNFSYEIFDYCAGLALRDCLAENNGQVDAGVWFTSAKTKPTQLIRLHHMAFLNAWPLTWFIIEHFALGTSRHGRRLNRSPSADTDNQVRSELSARVKKIVIGDEEAVRDLIRELVSAGEDRDAPDSIRVLPRHTITIKVTAGTSLPPDLARVQFD